MTFLRHCWLISRKFYRIFLQKSWSGLLHATLQTKHSSSEPQYESLSENKCTCHFAHVAHQTFPCNQNSKLIIIYIVPRILRKTNLYVFQSISPFSALWPLSPWAIPFSIHVHQLPKPSSANTPLIIVRPSTFPPAEVRRRRPIKSFLSTHALERLSFSTALKVGLSAGVPMVRKGKSLHITELIVRDRESALGNFRRMVIQQNVWKYFL